jgi:hypothetical protein
MEFVTNFLEISPNRCFYEIIRNSRPCKAYLDLEADAGAMSEQEGEEMCAAVNREWKRRVTNRWPTVVEQCKQSLGHMILNGSRMTDKGLKISYHIIYPWLVFPCNTTTLRDEVGSMSEMPQFHYSLASGERKSFIDQECTPVIGSFDSCFATSSRIGHEQRFACHNIRPFPCSFDLVSPTLVITSDWFPMMIFRGCCEVSTPETKEENLVATTLDYRP